METAEKWGLTNRRVQSYCVENRIAGAVRHGGVWFIPETAVKPDRIKQGVKKNPAKRCLNVLSLFPGCGGMDPCFEGGFDVLQVSVNEKVNPGWETRPVTSVRTRLPRTMFKTVFANDVMKAAKAAWCNYFNDRGVP